MLHDALIDLARIAGFETKSADVPPHPVARRYRANRYRPRRTVSDRVREAVLTLAESKASLLTHEETAWHSITFSGTRHEFMLDFDGIEAVVAGENFLEALPEHEFNIPGHLVADATIREVDHRFGANERMVLTAVLLLLEEG